MNNKFYALAQETGFSMWQDEPHRPHNSVIDWGCDYTKEFEDYSEQLVKWVVSRCRSHYNSGITNWCEVTLREFELLDKTLWGTPLGIKHTAQFWPTNMPG